MYFYPHEKVKYNYNHLICIKIIAEDQLEGAPWVERDIKCGSLMGYVLFIY